MDVNRFGITIKCIEIDQKLTKKKRHRDSRQLSVEQ